MSDNAGISQGSLAGMAIPSNLSFGVELELLCTSLQPYQGLQHLQSTLDAELPHRNWRVVQDNSIKCNRADGPAQVPAEVKSGVLQSRRGADEVYRAVAALKATTSLEVNWTCGLHVHVGYQGRRWTLPELQVLLSNLVALEGAFDQLMPPSRRNNGYCKSIRGHMGGTQQALRTIAGCKSTEELVAAVNPGQRVIRADGTTLDKGRYYKLNLHSLYKAELAPGTVEFRQPAASQNADKAMGFILLCVKFVELSCLNGKRVGVLRPEAEWQALLDFFQGEPVIQNFLRARQLQVERAGCSEDYPGAAAGYLPDSHLDWKKPDTAYSKMDGYYPAAAPGGYPVLPPGSGWDQIKLQPRGDVEMGTPVPAVATAAAEEEGCECTTGWVLFGLGWLVPILWLAGMFVPCCSRKRSDRWAAIASGAMLMIYIVIIAAVSYSSAARARAYSYYYYG